MSLNSLKLLIVAAIVAGQLHSNISIGGTDTSSNAAGLQARWDDGGSFAGVFVGATTLDAVAEGKLPEGHAAIVVAVADRGVDAGLQTYLWTPRVEQTIRGTQVLPGSDGSAQARALLQRAATRFQGLHVTQSQSSTPVAYAVAPTPKPPVGDESRKPRGAGSTQAGLPALSTDPNAHIIQAGWLEGTRRYGVIAHGEWHVTSGTRLTSGERGDWLVAFELDQNTGRVALLQAVHAVAGVEIGHAVDGQNLSFDIATSPWAARVVEWLAAVAAARSNERASADADVHFVPSAIPTLTGQRCKTR